jgi:hypothetical protein
MTHIMLNDRPVDDPAFPPWALWTSIGTDGRHPGPCDSLSTSLVMITHLIISIVKYDLLSCCSSCPS